MKGASIKKKISLVCQRRHGESGKSVGLMLGIQRKGRTMNAKLLVLLAAGLSFACIAEMGRKVEMPGMPEDVTTYEMPGMPGEEPCCGDLEQECVYTHTPCIKEVGKRIQVHEYAPSHCFKTQKNLCVEKVYTVPDHSRNECVICKDGVCKPCGCDKLECPKPCAKKCCPKPCCRPCERRCHKPCMKKECTKPCHEPCIKKECNKCERPCARRCNKPCAERCEKRCPKRCVRECPQPCPKPCACRCQHCHHEEEHPMD